MIEKQGLLAHRGIRLPKRVLGHLNEIGVFAQPHVSLERQHLARRYVMRGIESGGAVKGIGRYVTFCGPTGEPLHLLCPIDAIALNGLHAVVIAPILVRVELFRASRTYQLLITRHEPAKVEDGRRPPVESRILFRGVNGFLDRERTDKDNGRDYSAMPRFWSRAGEEREIPALFVPVVRAAILGTNCCGCSHTHFSVAPSVTATTVCV